ncbi:MAG: AAA family ATPase [Chloroflexi bacterium]|nr:MAG: AAA family ATPase [Chloroflexota bacterium]TMG37829.1 MAG: AAA family ATPase [Chloroflexota bacterium]
MAVETERPTAPPTAAESPAPFAPQSIEETGLSAGFIGDLALKILYKSGQATGGELAEMLCIPFGPILAPILDFLKNERLTEVKGAAGVGPQAYQYVLTDAGTARAREAFDKSGYVGPAPVTLGAYVGRVRAQSIGSLKVSMEELKKALGHLVLPERTLRQLGPAINSGRSIFLFGPPGTGKSSIAETLATLLKGNIVIPYVVQVGEQLVRVFDPSRHRPLVALDQRFDRRWVPIARPFVQVGGELTLEQLDLGYDPFSKVHEAPFQMKASGGVLLIDDFGRQRASPDQLLNRWIVPLDRDIDFLTLADGRKIEVRFDVLLVFSTNRTPSSLVDEAFLRRIQYKIELKSPTEPEFAEILRRVCAQQQLQYYPQAAEWIVEYAKQRNIALRSCHPRDLMTHLHAAARFLGKPAEITPELIELACETYFVPL